MVTISAPRFRYSSLGMLVGTFLVQKLSNTLLQIIFLYFIPIPYMDYWPRKRNGERVENAQDPIISKTSTYYCGSLVGFISSFIGSWGTITSHHSWLLGFNTRKCIATSSMLGVIIATIGSIMGIVCGWQQTELANYYLGFIYLPALLASVSPVYLQPAYRRKKSPIDSYC